MPKTATRTPRATRSPLRREAILDEARAIVRGHGVESLSLRRLARNLGVTAPALYAHIQDKGDLLRAVAEAEFERLVERMDKVDHADPLERLAAYSRAYIDHSRSEPELFDLMFLFAPELGSTGLPPGVELPAATRAFTLPLSTIVEAIEAGTLVSADPLIVSLTMWTSAHGVATALRLGLNLPPDVEAALIDESIGRVIAGWTRPAGP